MLICYGEINTSRAQKVDVWDFFPRLVDRDKLVPIIYFVPNLSRQATSYCFPQHGICATFTNMYAVSHCFLLEKCQLWKFFINIYAPYQTMFNSFENILNKMALF